MKTHLLNLKFSVMKQILFLVAVAAFMVACNRNPGSVAVNEAEMAEFMAWKAEKAELAEKEKTAALTAKPAARKTAAKRNTSYTSPVMVSESQYPAKVEKKGWSKAAKGAVIGAGAGAVAGAVINKRNRAVGAVVGGVIGGGIGYGVGRHMDKKDGRVM